MITGRAPDGTVEAIEAIDRDFVIGVQWHAETLQTLPEHAALFAAFVDSAAGVARRRHPPARSLRSTCADLPVSWPSAGAADRAAVERMADTMRDRGPDGEGSWAHDAVALAHRRLKIIDLTSAGSQPMVDSDLGLTIVFNGCIYNYRELRAELEARRLPLLLHQRHRGDPQGLREVGARVRQPLRRDVRLRDLRARQRPRAAGPRPARGQAAVPGRDGGALRFASTLPALLAGGGIDTAIDPVALHHYLSWHAVVPPPRTILNGVQKLPPATTMLVEPDGRGDLQRYWRADFSRRDEYADWTDGDWADAVLEALRVAVKRRMVSDVPVGVLLSGGLDSSLIVALLETSGQERAGHLQHRL